MVTKAEVNNFLREFKKIGGKRGITLIRRAKNSLAETGLTTLNFHNEILSLTYKNYCRGPELDKDKNFAGKVWIFGKNISHDEYYIKLKITHDKTRVVCISFHLAEYPINYPLK